MKDYDWKAKVKIFDDRRNIVIPGDKQATLDFCVKQFIALANQYIDEQGYFAVALSGGSTPKAIYTALATKENKDLVDWSKVLLFFGDERSVDPSSEESNYHMAMQAAFSSLPLKAENIFRMEAEKDIEENAEKYEKLLLEKIPSKKFDLVLLGMGDDGHTASLFPKTHGLKDEHHLVVANYVPQKSTWRMTLTYDCINSARNIVIYVLGKGKETMVKQVLLGEYQPDLYPIQKIGTLSHRALWIMDNDAAKEIVEAN